jgi:hypothetical protein
MRIRGSYFSKALMIDTLGFSLFTFAIQITNFNAICIDLRGNKSFSTKGACFNLTSKHIFRIEMMAMEVYVDSPKACIQV